MEAVLLIDFGSTNTKVTAVDLVEKRLLGTAAAYTTVETDIGDGLKHAMGRLEQTTGTLDYTRRYACSSAAGGLRMVASGLVPDLTAKAARLACLGAGAKLAKVFSYQMTEDDIEEIAALKPDIFLLAGGTDGGDKECILHNASLLADCKAEFPILIAGNRVAARECERLLAGREVHRCENVMPSLQTLNIEPVQQKIREIFLRRIVQAKGLSEATELLDQILMPTPSAMLRAMELLSAGTKTQKGFGELVAVDLGGATTDVYSIAAGLPRRENAVLKGIQEPVSKRTVEGDIGMRYSASGVLEAAGTARLSQLSGLPPEQVTAMVQELGRHPDLLPDTPEREALDTALACAAVETALTRHAGTIEEVYTPMGLAFAQSGKDLTGVETLVITGGAVVHHKKAGWIASHGLYSPTRPGSLCPQRATIHVDKSYILAAMGLLGEAHPDVAFTIMTKELIDHGTYEQTA